MKGIKRTGLVLSSIFLACAGMSSWAACSLLPCGWYIDGNVGASTVSDTNFGVGTSSKMSSAAGNINAGYKFSPFVAMEVGYTYFSKEKIQNAANVTVATVTNSGYDFALKGIMPIANSGFEVFGKLGGIRLRSKTSVNNAAAAAGMTLPPKSHDVSTLYIGAGADYAITESIPFIVQWARAKGDSTTGHLDIYTIGIGYIFE